MYPVYIIAELLSLKASICVYTFCKAQYNTESRKQWMLVQLWGIYCKIVASSSCLNMFRFGNIAHAVWWQSCVVHMKYTWTNYICIHILYLNYTKKSLYRKRERQVLSYRWVNYYFNIDERKTHSTKAICIAFQLRRLEYAESKIN